MSAENQIRHDRQQPDAVQGALSGRSSFECAVGGVRPKVAPVWFMRQAGRSLPEYRQLREGTTMLESCLTPELAAEITLQPVRRHHVDAAIFFSDIMVPLKLADIDVDIAPGVGPVMGKAYRTADDIHELISTRLGDTQTITDAVRGAIEMLSEIETRDGEGHEMKGVPLIGFGGAPFTLAAYLVEGRPSKDHLTARTLMHAEPELWHELMTWAADLTGDFIKVQIDAGASAVQLFDSWAGSLSRADYLRFVLPYSKRALEGIEVPKIHFGLGTGEFLADMAEIADVIGVDYHLELSDAIDRVATRLGRSPSVQGNINPALLGAPFDVLEAHTMSVLEAGQKAQSHIVNLGHGVPPSADPAVLTKLVETIHNATIGE